MPRLLPLALATVLAAGLLAAAAHAGSEAGERTPWVIDGDTLAFGAGHVRLEGIDAPESKQTCTAYGQDWPCGQMATAWLREAVAGRDVTCTGHARDRYGRLLGTCFVGGENLNARIVAEGWAVAYRYYGDAYVPEEDAARRAGRGIWRGTFEEPWRWRREHRAP